MPVLASVVGFCLQDAGQEPRPACLGQRPAQAPLPQESCFTRSHFPSHQMTVLFQSCSMFCLCAPLTVIQYRETINSSGQEYKMFSRLVQVLLVHLYDFNFYACVFIMSVLLFYVSLAVCMCVCVWPSFL